MNISCTCPQVRLLEIGDLKPDSLTLMTERIHPKQALHIPTFFYLKLVRSKACGAAKECALRTRGIH